jgi:hypothetical protein
MENTARKLTSAKILADIKESHGSLDLLKVFLITGATDISKSYELVKSWAKAPMINDADKANFENALKTLQAIELKRVELTSLIYGIDSPVVEVEAEKDNVILMLPSLDETLDKVRVMFKGCENLTKTKDVAFMELKATVGSGKVMTSEKQAITWDDEKINQFIETVAGPVTEGNVAYGFGTVYEHLKDMVDSGAEEPAIKASLATLLIGKKIIGNKADDYFIKDEKVFEDYYTRILSALVVSAINNREEKKKITNSEVTIEKEIAETIIPELKKLDADVKQGSFATVTKMLKGIYEKFNHKISLGDSLAKAQELAITAAPNLLIRNKETKVTNLPTVPIGCTDIKKETHLEEIAAIIEPQQTAELPIEIYDETHNIKESNKELWTEVENYDNMQQILDKGVDLCKRGLWKDALSMSVILISAGKICKEKGSKEKVLWDTDQIVDWYSNNIKNAIDPTAVIVKDGPAVKAGTLDVEPKEDVTRLLKDSSPYKDKYAFKSFTVKSNRGKNALIFQVLDATLEQEPKILITELNMFRFFDDLRKDLALNGNSLPKARTAIREEFEKFYDITGSEVKGMAGNLLDEATAYRKANKKETSTDLGEPTTAILPDATKSALIGPGGKILPDIIVEPTIPVEEPAKVVPTTEPEPAKEVVASPPVTPVVPGKTEDDKTTETTPVEDTTSSNDKVAIDYTGFEDIVKAKTKFDLHKAIYAKASKFTDLKEGVKAIFEIVNVARHDKHYKGKTQIGNWNPTPLADLLNNIQRIVDKGAELANSRVLAG